MPDDTITTTAEADNASSQNKLHKTEKSDNIAVTRSSHNSIEELERVVNESDFSQEKTLKLPENAKTDQQPTQESTREECQEPAELPVKKDCSSGEHIADPETEKDTPLVEVIDKKPRIGLAASEQSHPDRICRNQSDIFSLQEHSTVASSIFSVNGSPSRKIYRKKALNSTNVLPFGQHCEPPSEKLPSPRDKMREGRDNYNDVKRPSSSIRNPLTGTGLSSNDEYKFKGSKRKDGNPLLGLGYSPEVTPSAHRIPPGGYSHKLW